MGTSNKVVKLANFKSAQKKSFDEECAEAYAWILQVQKTQGWYSEQIRLTFEDGDYIKESNCMIALFIDKESGKAILCREWPDDMMVKFNQIINPVETKLRAPKCYQKMVETGLELYRREGRGFHAIYCVKQSRKKEN